MLNPILHGLWEIHYYTGRGTKCPGIQNPFKLIVTISEQSKFDQKLSLWPSTINRNQKITLNYLQLAPKGPKIIIVRIRKYSQRKF